MYVEGWDSRGNGHTRRWYGKGRDLLEVDYFVHKCKNTCRGRKVLVRATLGVIIVVIGEVELIVGLR